MIALTALYSVLLAIAITLALTHEHPSLIVGAALLLPILVSRLARKADRERDHAHPSR